MGKKKRELEQDQYVDEHKLKVEKIEDETADKKVKRQEENLSYEKIEKSYSSRKENSFFLTLFLVLVLLTSIGYFASIVIYKKNSIDLFPSLISGVLLVLFNILFVVIAIKSHIKKKAILLFGSFLLLFYQSFGILSLSGIVSFSTMNKVVDFSSKSLTEVVAWAAKNKVEIKQDYEYSDMIPEYSIISQDAVEGTKIKDIKALTVAVSEGPNPAKEIIVPNMVSWNSERVIEYIKENHLSNVEVEFVESDKQKDTVIEQSKSGNLKRNDEMKLTFSAGEKFDEGDVKLIDFTGKSKFEVTFYLKQHRIRYEFEDSFSKEIKRGYAMKQSIKAGSMVKVNDEKVKVTMSKGPEIKIPDLKKMSMTEITSWVIQNKLKLEFTDRYDDTAKDNEVLEVNYSKGDVVEQSTLIKVVLSKGKLKMPKFNSLQDFRDWADKYSIAYEEKHEFSDSVAAGEVISYSYKTGDVIKNSDTIIVTISDGEKLEVPNLKGLSKDDIISKLKKLGLNYSFVYKSSSDVAKDKAMSQSISAGSEVSKGTTITVTISSGKSSSTSSGSSNNNSGGNNDSGSNNGSSGGNEKPNPPSCDRNKTIEIRIQSSLNSDSVNSTKENYRRNYPGIIFDFKTRPSNIGTTGMVHPDTTSKRVIEANYCDPVEFIIIQN